MQEHSLEKRCSVKLFTIIISAFIGDIMIATIPKETGPFVLWVVCVFASFF